MCSISILELLISAFAPDSRYQVMGSLPVCSTQLKSVAGSLCSSSSLLVLVQPSMGINLFSHLASEMCSFKNRTSVKMIVMM